MCCTMPPSAPRGEHGGWVGGREGGPGCRARLARAAPDLTCTGSTRALPPSATAAGHDLLAAALDLCCGQPHTLWPTYRTPCNASPPPTPHPPTPRYLLAGRDLRAALCWYGGGLAIGGFLLAFVFVQSHTATSALCGSKVGGRPGSWACALAAGVGVARRCVASGRVRSPARLLALCRAGGRGRVAAARRRRACHPPCPPASHRPASTPPRCSPPATCPPTR